MATETIPPQSLESEMSVLGAIFVDNDAIDTAHDLLKPEDLYKETHRTIFKAMSVLSDRREPIDLVTVSNVLKGNGELEMVGGGAYLYSLSEYVPMAANIGHYCRIVKEKAAERRLILKAREAIGLAFQGGKLDEALTKLEAAIQPEIDKQGNAPVAVDQTIRDAMARMEFRRENRGRITGIPYGINGLDKATLGMHPGELIIVAGRPSMGKSALGGNFIRSAADESKIPMLFTLEMARTDIMDRIFAGFGVAYQNIRSGMLKENDYPKLIKAAERARKWTFPIDDTPAISLRDLRAKARRQKKQGLDLLVIDYLQLMSVSDPKISRVLGIGEISRGLKQLARELEIPVVCLSQLSRSVDSRNDKRPMMSDLRDSGEIEQDADVILFPYRPAAYCEKCRDKIDNSDHNLAQHQAQAEIIIEKQRAGERNISVPVIWRGEFQRFEDLKNYADEECPFRD